VIRVQQLSRAAGALLLVALVTSCSPPDAPSDPKAEVTRTVTASPTPTEPSETPPTTAPTEPVTTDPGDGGESVTGAVPAELVGTWDSVDQGSAEDLIEIHTDGSYLRAMVLMQQRPSGMFSYTIGTKGNVEVQGTTLRLVPTEGTESMTDPDSPGDSYTDQPTDLTPEVYQWSASNGSIFLDGEFGVVEFRPST
jgi:hypothetical protein